MAAPLSGPPRGGHYLFRGWRIVVGFLAATLILTYPLSVDPANSVLVDAPDTNIFIWTLAWNSHALTAQPLSMFDANIYYPQTRTLAYSDNMIGNVMFAAPVIWLTGNYVLALNVVTLLTCALCGIGAYVLARRLDISPPGALLCGLIFEFAPPRLLRISQVTLGVHWMPFSLAYLHAYFKNGRPRDLKLAAAFFTLQVLTSGQGAVFLLVASLALVLYRLVLGEPLAIARRLSDLGLRGAILLLPVALMVLPYFAVQREMGLRRTLENWTVSSASFLASPTHVHRILLSLFVATDINHQATAILFPGYLPVLLAAVALFAGGGLRAEGALRVPPVGPPGAPWARRVGLLMEIAAVALLGLALFTLVEGPVRLKAGDTVVLSVRQSWRVWLWAAAAAAIRVAIVRQAPLAIVSRLRHSRDAYRQWAENRRHDSRTFYALLTILGFWLSVGPPLGLWPLVYWLPGLNFIRVPSRFTLISVLGLAVLSGIGFEWLTRRLTMSERRVWAMVVGLLLTAEFAVLPWGTTKRRIDIPAVDRWLDTQPKPFAIAEVPLAPFGGGDAWERRQTEYMLHATAHWQKTVHGYSGLRPPLHAELYQRMRTFPDSRSLDALRSLHVDYVVVHSDLYPQGEWPIVEARIEAYRDSLRLEHADGAGRVYSLRPAVLNAHAER